MGRTDSLEKTLMLGNTEGRKRRGQQRKRWLNGITNSMAWVWPSSGNWWWIGKPGVLQSMGPHRVRLNWVTELTWRMLSSVPKPELGRNKAQWRWWHMHRFLENSVSSSRLPETQKESQDPEALCWFSLLIWRRQWHPTLVLLPGKSHGWRSLVGFLLWGRTESYSTKLLSSSSSLLIWCSSVEVVFFSIVSSVWLLQG